MRPVVGVICEYDPFHLGHARQFALIRSKLPDAAIVCVMSGCFSQRGMPTLFAPDFRARAALNAGADLVLELPCAFAVRDAENFALGGVAILNALGFVTHLSFGCESAELSGLQRAALLLEHPTVAFTDALHAELARGRSFAAAQGAALAAVSDDAACADGAPHSSSAGDTDTPRQADERHSEPLAEQLSKPNNVLALCYLRALERLQSVIEPLPVQRDGDYHASALGQGFPSATAVRGAFLSGDTEAAQTACGYAFGDAPTHAPCALDRVLLHRLRQMSVPELKALPNCSEGLENRLNACAQNAVDRDSLLSLLKTKRYAYARLNRLATHALLGVTAELLREFPLPTYARLLGFGTHGRALLPLLRGSALPILAKAADADRNDPLLRLDARAYDLWALGADLPAGLMFRQQVVTPV